MIFSYNKKNRIFFHLLFWVLVVMIYTLFFSRNNENFWLTLFFIGLLTPVTILASYFLNYVLIPRYLLHRRYWKFGLYFTYTLLGTIYLNMIILVIIFITMADYKWANMNPLIVDIPFIMSAMLMVVFMATAIRLVFLWFDAERNNQQLLLEKLDSELKFLKAQIHPHFFFNTLNNLYFLTLQKSDKAPDVVLKLGELFNYILYECTPRFVSLEKELAQAHNYIDLEMLRYEDRLHIEVNVSGNMEGKMIAPLLLINLLENSFKHGIMKNTKKSWIKLNVAVEGENISISLKNSKRKMKQDNEGIGLQNLQKQLELIYEKPELLQINENDTEYSVQLHL